MKTTFIYGLNDPITGRCRYVGKAASPQRRYETHERAAKAGKKQYHVYCWWRSLLAAGQAPILEVLDEVPETNWEFWEREYIRLFRVIFPGLTNHTDGGEGNDGPRSPETRAKVSIASKGRAVSQETRAKISATTRGKKFSPETCAKISAALTGRIMSPEWRANLSAAHKGKPALPHSPEALAKMSAANKGKVVSQETRAKLSVALTGKTHSPETRVKMSAAHKLRLSRHNSPTL